MTVMEDANEAFSLFRISYPIRLRSQQRRKSMVRRGQSRVTYRLQWLPSVPRTQHNFNLFGAFIDWWLQLLLLLRTPTLLKMHATLPQNIEDASVLDNKMAACVCVQGRGGRKKKLNLCEYIYIQIEKERKKGRDKQEIKLKRIIGTLNDSFTFISRILT